MFKVAQWDLSFLLLLFLFLIIIVHILLEINELQMDCKVQDYKMCLQVFRHLLFEQYLPVYSLHLIGVSWDVGLLQSCVILFLLSLISMVGLVSGAPNEIPKINPCKI